MPTARQPRSLKLIVTDQGTSECRSLSTSCVDSTRPALAGSGSLAGGVGHVSESWLFYYGAAGSVLSVVSTLNCVGAEARFKWWEWSVGSVGSVVGTPYHHCLHLDRYALEGHPLGAVTIP